MSLLSPKTIPLFHFTGDYATTPICPVDMQPNLNPSSGAQSYRSAGSACTRSAKYNLPFFLENLGPRFSEWSVNAHEARPGHHTQVSPSSERLKADTLKFGIETLYISQFALSTRVIIPN